MRAALTLCVLWLCGCSGRSDAPEKADAAESSADASTISLGGEVFSYQFEADSETRPHDARVCQDESRRCTKLLPDGRWMLDGLAPEREILLTFEAPGYITTLRPLVTPTFSSNVGLTGMIPHEVSDMIGVDANAIRVQAGLPELETKSYEGSISFSAILRDGISLDPRSVHVRLEPESGSEPVYAPSDSDELTLELGEGQIASFASLLNVEPRDDYALVYTMDDGECSYFPGVWSGWPAEDGRTNVIRVPVRANATTYATALRCVRNDAPPPRQGGL